MTSGTTLLHSWCSRVGVGIVLTGQVHFSSTFLGYDLTVELSY